LAVVARTRPRRLCSHTAPWYIHYFIHEQVGNKQFRALISAALNEYMNANARDKSRIVDKVVGQVQATGGRFMRRDVQGAMWYELTRRKAREKVIHALKAAVNLHQAQVARGNRVQNSATNLPTNHALP
jgi:hypothetical protein